MNTPPNHRLEEIFAQAAALPEGEREAWLEAACAGYPELRPQVERLLRAHEASGFMARVPQRMEIEAEIARLKPEGAGDRIDHYKLIEQIGEGGFGTVWLAEQQRPVQRQVALKIIKLGMDTREVIARFEQERQALAVMNHPNIAKVHDAGATQFGRPYFVMELVRGTRITQYCDETKLPPRERLKLFVQVCQAVQHAHQKGIIHRDLKPSNILVTEQDGVPVPKVIDFGVAKATQGRLAEATITTDIEQMIGTPLYMSPEQAGFNGVDVDTRSDIYSLGVVLYELLTGRTPFNREDVARAGYAEIRQMICGSDPKKPSTALQTMAAPTVIALARARQCEPSELIHALRGDLDWITMKAIEKDRTRRYATVNGLALDVHRYLIDETVSATPPSRSYRIRKFARRHKLSLLAAASVAAALVIGLIASLWQANRATRAEVQLSALLDEAIASQDRAEAAFRARAASELKARRISNASDMNRVQEALRLNDVGLARRLLDQNRPAADAEDVRGWEWRYFYQESRSGALEMLAKRDGTPVFATSYSRDGTMLLAGYGDGHVDLWDLAARTKRTVQPAFGSAARAVFAPRGESFAAVTSKGVVKNVDVKTGAERILCKVPGSIRDLSYSADGEWLAVLSRSPEELTVVGVADGSIVKTRRFPGQGGTFFNNARISPNKARIYVTSGAFTNPTLHCLTMHVQDVGWTQPIGLIDESEPESRSDIGFSAMELSPNGHFLVVATGYRDPRIRVLRAETGELITVLKGHTSYVRQLAFSSDGRILVSCSEDQTIRRWDTETWKQIDAPFLGHPIEVGAVAISSDSRFLASGDKDGELLLWDTQAPRLPRGRRNAPSDIQSVSALPVGRVVAGQMINGEWSLVDLLTLARERLSGAELLPDGRGPRFVPNKLRRLPRRLDRAALGLAGTLTGSAVSPDGKLLVVGSESGEIGFYDALNRKLIEIARSGLGSVFGVAFSPDGKRLVLSSGGDRGIAIWDVVIRQEVAVLSSYGSLLSEVQFTGDGNTLVVGPKPTGGGKGPHYFWHAPSFQEIEAAERIGGPWPLPSAFSAPPPALSLAKLKIQLEADYRKRLAEPWPQLPEAIQRRDETVEDLAELLQQQNRFADAAPLFHELLEKVRQRVPDDDTAVLDAAKKLLKVSLSAMETENLAADSASTAIRAKQADDLVADLLAIHTRQFAASSKDALTPLTLAMLHVWFGRTEKPASSFLLEEAKKKPGDVIAVMRAAVAMSLRSSDDPAISARALQLAQSAVKLANDPAIQAWCQQALGLAYYRSKNDVEAEKALLVADQLAAKFSGAQYNSAAALRTTIGFIRCMALWRLGRETEAKTLFAQLEAKMQLFADDRRIFESTSYEADLMTGLAYKEAKALVRRDPSEESAKPR